MQCLTSLSWLERDERQLNKKSREGGQVFDLPLFVYPAAAATAAPDACASDLAGLGIAMFCVGELELSTTVTVFCTPAA